MNDFLLHGGDAARILALHHVLQLCRELQVALFVQLAVFYDVYGDVAVNVAQHIVVQIDGFVDFDNVLLAVFGTVGVLNDGHAVADLVQAQQFIYHHALSCFDMV